MSSLLRTWDATSNDRVDHFFVNSTFVGKRVDRYYGRHDWETLSPPIELDRFAAAQHLPRLIDEPYFLAAGALVSYKRFDLAIEAAEAAGRRLVVAGEGPYAGRLKSMAGPNTTFESAPPDHRWDSLLANAEALIFPGVEDFGMIAIESMAAGTPVIAAAQGGALDFIIPGKTGMFFPPGDRQTLSNILQYFDKTSIALPPLESLNASYGKDRFLQAFREKIVHICTPSGIQAIHISSFA
jgi:glycosyltransferase involved in cell wall biosynthesis